MRRSRTTLVVLGALVLALGLSTIPLRRVLPSGVAENLGDALWAMLAYLLCALVFPRGSRGRLAATAFIISTAVECSQLYHAPWSDHLRATTLGGLVLGWGFAWGDLACYAAGIALCFVLDRPRRD